MRRKCSLRIPERMPERLTGVGAWDGEHEQALVADVCHDDLGLARVPIPLERDRGTSVLACVQFVEHDRLLSGSSHRISELDVFDVADGGGPADGGQAALVVVPEGRRGAVLQAGADGLPVHARASAGNSGRRAQRWWTRAGLRPDHSLGSQHAETGGPDMLWPLRLETPKPIRHPRFEAIELRQDAALVSAAGSTASASNVRMAVSVRP